MIIDILLCVLVAILFVWVVILTRKYDKTLDMLSNLALRTREVENLSHRVDESMGATMYKLEREFDQFKELYGDAAVEEMKESARAQKAFADGLNDIVSFGANLYGRGDST